MDADDFEGSTRTMRRWLNRQTVSTDRLVEELAFWREYMADPPNVPTPAAGQIWSRDSRHQFVRVEAFVPESSLGPLVVWTFCGVAGRPSPYCEHVETFLRRSSYSHGDQQ